MKIRIFLFFMAVATIQLEFCSEERREQQNVTKWWFWGIVGMNIERKRFLRNFWEKKTRNTFTKSMQIRITNGWIRITRRTRCRSPWIYNASQIVDCDLGRIYLYMYLETGSMEIRLSSIKPAVLTEKKNASLVIHRMLFWALWV